MNPEPQRPAAARAAGADDAFGADLLGRLGAGNLVFSPASIAGALRMALLGARGATAAELAGALHLAGPAEAGDGLRLLSAGLASLASDRVTCRAPNTMWVQAGLPLLPAFTSALAGLAAVSLREADFMRAAEQARVDINALVAEQTAGKIPVLVAPGTLDARTRLVLVNAVYLKAPWAHPFPAGATADGPFRVAGGATVSVPMMRRAGQIGYLRGVGYQAALLPYAGGGLAMAVILPDGPLGPLEEALTGTRPLLAGAEPAQVQLTMPRFRMTAQFDLVPVLASLGIAAAFGPDADFSGITAEPGLAISAVVHQAFIDVDEQGTEAAAATAVIARAMALSRPQSPPIEMTVDRPFLFAIIETGSALPLFLGRVTEPRPA